MADPLSIGASVLAFVGLAEKVIRLSKHCIDAVKDAPSDMQMILGEVASLKAVVESCRDGAYDPSGLVARLFAPSGPVDACTRCLGILQGLLPPEKTVETPGKKRKVSLAELAWPLKQGTARKLLAEISHHKASLLLAISGDMSHDIKEIQTNLQKVVRLTSASESREVFQWLERQSRHNPSTLHNNAFKKHEAHTSAWFLRAPEWQQWLSPATDARFLWLHGLPGSGKTVLASVAVEHLKTVRRQSPGTCLAYYYCHYSHRGDEALPLLSWVVGQACRHLSWVPPELQELFDHGHDPQVHELQNVLAVLLERRETLYLVIDAVDESTPRDDLLSLASVLVLDKRFAKVRMFGTSREYFDIQRVFGGLSTALSMSNDSVDEDLRLFVRAKLVASRRLHRWRDMFGEIEDVLVREARGMFRWTECQILSIERLRDISDLHRTLADLPRDISETYVRIFEAIPEEDRQLMRRILIWVVGHLSADWLSERGINATMLLSAVDWEIHGPSVGRRSSALDVEDLQELCGCLMTFRSDGMDDDDGTHLSEVSNQFSAINLVDNPSGVAERPTRHAELYVHLAHYTVLEFLTSPHILDTPVAYFATSQEAMDAEFSRSVLRQALASDPRGCGTDWVHDREAYCLTLGASFFTQRYLADKATRELFMQYLSPAGQHYARFRPLQAEMADGREDSDCFYVNRLPGLYLVPSTGEPRNHAAETLLNQIFLQHGRTVNRDVLVKFTQGQRPEALLGMRVRMLIRTPALAGMFSDRNRETEFEGTLTELLSGLALLATR